MEQLRYLIIAAAIGVIMLAFGLGYVVSYLTNSVLN